MKWEKDVQDYHIKYWLLLFCTGNVLFHVVKGILRNSLLKDEIFQLMAVAVVLYTRCYFTEAVQENFIISAVLLIIPEWREEMVARRLSKNLCL